MDIIIDEHIDINKKEDIDDKDIKINNLFENNILKWLNYLYEYGKNVIEFLKDLTEYLMEIQIGEYKKEE